MDERFLKCLLFQHYRALRCWCCCFFCWFWSYHQYRGFKFVQAVKHSWISFGRLPHVKRSIPNTFKLSGWLKITVKHSRKTEFTTIFQVTIAVDDTEIRLTSWYSRSLSHLQGFKNRTSWAGCLGFQPSTVSTVVQNHQRCFENRSYNTPIGRQSCGAPIGPGETGPS